MKSTERRSVGCTNEWDEVPDEVVRRIEGMLVSDITSLFNFGCACRRFRSSFLDLIASFESAAARNWPLVATAKKTDDAPEAESRQANRGANGATTIVGSGPTSEYTLETEFGETCIATREIEARRRDAPTEAADRRSIESMFFSLVISNFGHLLVTNVLHRVTTTVVPVGCVSSPSVWLVSGLSHDFERSRYRFSQAVVGILTVPNINLLKMLRTAVERLLLTPAFHKLHHSLQLSVQGTYAGAFSSSLHFVMQYPWEWLNLQKVNKAHFSSLRRNFPVTFQGSPRGGIVNLRGASFCHSSVIEAVFRNCCMISSTLSWVAVKNLLLDHCDLSGADISHATLATLHVRNCLFTSSNISRVWIETTKVKEVDYCDFTGSHFANALLWNVSFRKTKFCNSSELRSVFKVPIHVHGCNFMGSDLRASKIRVAVDCNFRNSSLCFSKLGDLSYSDLTDADLRHSDLSEAILTGVKMQHCSFAGATLCLPLIAPNASVLRHTAIHSTILKIPNLRNCYWLYSQTKARTFRVFYSVLAWIVQLLILPIFSLLISEAFCRALAGHSLSHAAVTQILLFYAVLAAITGAWCFFKRKSAPDCWLFLVTLVFLFLTCRAPTKERMLRELIAGIGYGISLSPKPDYVSLWPSKHALTGEYFTINKK
ncbi:hypothetical protein Pelo_8472 [Pelomyxa schiedti]|nr:hypothetical protein Pelo_8472 [Pelomyxa schiedti]